MKKNTGEGISSISRLQNLTLRWALSMRCTHICLAPPRPFEEPRVRQEGERFGKHFMLCALLRAGSAQCSARGVDSEVRPRWPSVMPFSFSGGRSRIPSLPGATR